MKSSAVKEEVKVKIVTLNPMEQLLNEMQCKMWLRLRVDDSLDEADAIMETKSKVGKRKRQVQD